MKLRLGRKDKNSKIIRFVPDSERAEKILDCPSPGHKNVPEWYKKLSKYAFKESKFNRLPGHDTGPNDTNLTAKACKPMLDSFLVGYIVTLPTDVAVVDPAVYGGRVIWDSNTNMIESHAEVQVDGWIPPSEYEPGPYKWNFHWSIRVPRGYSLIYTHPFNRPELPFYTATGVVDADVYSAPVNLPFFLRKDFVGVIPKGTPVAQVVPIKREEWSHEVGTLEEFDHYEVEKMKLFMGGAYKKLFWSPKHYR